jgi:hypothetical protein
MKSEYSLIKTTTELPHNEENPFVDSSWGTLIRNKKECVLVHYIGLAPIFRRFLELNPNFKGKKSLLAVEENSHKKFWKE